MYLDNNLKIEWNRDIFSNVLTTLNNDRTKLSRKNDNFRSI